jgi:3'(2'), 5'-bisphosphate nucleotidase
MESIQQILSGTRLDGEIARRISAALALMNVQAIGSERLRQGVKTWTKADNSPVTIADLLHQSQLQHLLGEQFPDDGLICEEPRSLQEEVVEEASAASSEFYGMPIRAEVVHRPESGKVTWILDPIDGTKGYLAGRYYAIALGFFVDGRPLFGAMAVPHAAKGRDLAINGSLAFAAAGEGTWIGRAAQDGELQFDRLAVDQKILPSPIRIAISLEHGGTISQRLDSIDDVEIIGLDSQAKYLAVAAGDIDIYMRQNRTDGHPDVSWDHMPGALIATQAGCTVRHFSGEDIEFLPQEVLPLRGGMACHAGPKDGPLGQVTARIVG